MEDVNVLMWGVGPHWEDNRYNLKKGTKGDKMPKEERKFLISYKKKGGTLRFTSKSFDYYQEDLPAKFDYCICMDL